jgi:alpha-L-fucosidase 2
VSTQEKTFNSLLRFDKPAKNFNEALPIGNGRLGAMVYGGNQTEVLSLNEDSLWSGHAAPLPKPTAKAALGKVRELIFSGQHDKAEEIVQQDMLTEFNQPYLPAGELIIQWPENQEDDQYERHLSLDDAIVGVKSGNWTNQIKREYFVSGADQVIALQVTSDVKPLSNIKLSLGSKLRHNVSTSQSAFFLEGRIPSDVFWEDIKEAHTDSHEVFYDDDLSRHFVIGLTATSDTGLIQVDETGISIMGASDVTILVTISTGFNLRTPLANCDAQLASASAFNALELKQRHLRDYQQYYHRMELAFHSERSEQGNKKTETRLAEFNQGIQDPALFSDLFNYARYLLISSSRPGTMPANLQGIWNEQVMPPWWSNYTININTEMNYWAAESFGLGDCHTALLDFVASLAVAGAKTAKLQYGCRGWVAHHQTDYRRQTTPVGFRGETDFKQAAKWSMWPMGGAWLSLHFYDHYQYSGDLEYLKNKGYAVIKGAAEFLCDWLIDDPNAPEFLTTAPSTSPENTYVHSDGYRSSICAGSEMDFAITRTLFRAFIEVSDALGNPDIDLLNEVKNTLPRVPETRLTPDGRIREFDGDWPEAEHPHRHISQLFSLAPGHDICPTETPDMAEAARKTLEFRGDVGTGWSAAWKALCWIRLENPERAYSLLTTLMKPVSADIFGMADEGAGLYPNLLTACPPFQIDANFGFAAAIVEMLVQDHRGVIKLLPALPHQLEHGHVKGLRLKGNMELSMVWERGTLVSAVILSKTTQKREFLIENRVIEVALKKGTHVNLLDPLELPYQLSN